MEIVCQCQVWNIVIHIFRHDDCFLRVLLFAYFRKLLDDEEVGKVMKVLEESDIRTHEYGVS